MARETTLATAKEVCWENNSEDILTALTQKVSARREDKPITIDVVEK